MRSLIEKIRIARQTRVESAGKTFIVRRPTDLEMLEMRSAKAIVQRDILTRFVVGWEKMTELDFVAGGTGAEVAFDKALFDEWVSDHPEHWGKICDTVVDSYRKHEAELAESVKNSQPGS